MIINICTHFVNMKHMYTHTHTYIYIHTIGFLQFSVFACMRFKTSSSKLVHSFQCVLFDIIPELLDAPYPTLTYHTKEMRLLGTGTSLIDLHGVSFR